MGLEGRDLLRFFGIWGLGFKGKTFWAHSGGFRDLFGFLGFTVEGLGIFWAFLGFGVEGLREGFGVEAVR